MGKLIGILIVCCFLLSLEICNAASIPDFDSVPLVKRDTLTSRFVSVLCSALCTDNEDCFASFCGIGY